MTYDQWKTQGPDEGPVCEVCGGWLTQTWNGGLYCEDCEHRELEQRASDSIVEDDEAMRREDVLLQRAGVL